MGTSYDLYSHFLHIQPKFKNDFSVPRDFTDYDVIVNSADMLKDITLNNLVG